MTSRQPNWQLILDAAGALTASGQAPFTRISVYEWIWRRYPRSDHDRPSLDPTFQGMIGNAPGGPPSPCGTPLHRTGHGQYVLAQPRQEDRSVVAQVGQGTAGRLTGHAFISYVREDSAHVDRLQEILERAGIPVWRDVAHLWPGQDWRAQIRQAITRDALAFLACFSLASARRAQSYQNEELNEAIGQLRKRPQDVTWLIPIRFDDCQIPDMDIGGGRNLPNLHSANLFGLHYQQQAERLVQTIRSILDDTETYIPSAPAALIGRPPEISIAEPDVTDIGLRTPVRSVVYIDVAEPIEDLTAARVADDDPGSTTDLGYKPVHVSSSRWRIRSEFPLKSIRDIIIGYTTTQAGPKVRRFQWDGHDHAYDWHAHGADGSRLSALRQIKQAQSAVAQQPDRRPAREAFPEPQARLGAAAKPGFYGVQPDPETITASLVIQPAGRGNYDGETGNRVVITPIYSPYPLSYEPESRYGATPKLFLLVGAKPARSAASSTPGTSTALRPRPSTGRSSTRTPSGATFPAGRSKPLKRSGHADLAAGRIARSCA